MKGRLINSRLKVNDGEDREGSEYRQSMKCRETQRGKESRERQRGAKKLQRNSYCVLLNL